MNPVKLDPAAWAAIAQERAAWHSHVARQMTGWERDAYEREAEQQYRAARQLMGIE